MVSFVPNFKVLDYLLPNGANDSNFRCWTTSIRLQPLVLVFRQTCFSDVGYRFQLLKVLDYLIEWFEFCLC
jgi:hypothetical protein